jgi:hypothetical protein
MTKREGAIVGAYTGILVGKFEDLHEYIEEILGRPVFTHELSSDDVVKQITAASKQDFINLLDVKEEE